MLVLSKTIEDKLSEMFEFKFVPQTFVSLLVMLILVIISIIIGIKIKKQKIDEKPKGIVLLAIMFYELIDKFVVDIMGNRNKSFVKYIFALAPYIFLAFIISLTGLPSPIVYIATPLSLALITFVAFHVTAIKENKWAYFKRYVDPIPIFLPINLLSMWAPLLSLTLRMFGNAISGFCIMSLLYYSLEGLSDVLFGLSFAGPVGYQSIFIAPIFTPALHLYFDLFSGFIQTLVFIMLTQIYILQEQNEPDENRVIEEVLS